MSDMYRDVVTFIEACDQKPSSENVELYKDLIIEEFSEYIEAYSEHSDVEQIDACMDMIWVILGYCYMKGWDVKGAWNEIALSNLRKIDPKTKKVNKREDGKVLKPEGWKPPQLEKFVKQ